MQVHKDIEDRKFYKQEQRNYYENIIYCMETTSIDLGKRRERSLEK